MRGHGLQTVSSHVFKPLSLVRDSKGIASRSPLSSQSVELVELLCGGSMLGENTAQPALPISCKDPSV